jgi:hypothetical protein
MSATLVNDLCILPEQGMALIMDALSGFSRTSWACFLCVEQEHRNALQSLSLADVVKLVDTLS